LTFYNISSQANDTEAYTNVASLNSGVNPINEPSTPMFEVKNIPGKGKDLIACANIDSGTRILCEKPLLIAQPMSLNELERMLAAKLRTLPKASQRRFLSLHNNCPGKFPFSNTFKINALPCGPNSSETGVYPTTCFINHSYIPNAHNNWDSKAEHETIYAVRPITSGEKIVIAYDRGGPSNLRRAFLSKVFGFECDCHGCARPSSELEESDARRLMIEALDDSIGDLFRISAMPEKSLWACQLLLEVLDEEYGAYAGILNACVYYDAFQVCIAHGDQARASVFAEKSYDARVVCEGEGSPEAQRMKAFALTPETHNSFGTYSMKWKTSRATIPKGLNQVEFQVWLFARTRDGGTDSDAVLDSSSGDVDSECDGGAPCHCGKQWLLVSWVSIRI
jgi:hypothetical protein